MHKFFEQIETYIYSLRFSIGHIINSVSPIVLLILLTNYVDIVVYGAYSKVIIILGFITPFISFNFSEFYLFKYLNQSKGNSGTLVGISIIVSLIISAVILICSAILFSLFNFEILDILLAILLALTNPQIENIRAHAIAINSHKKYYIINSVQLIFTVGLIIMFIVFVKNIQSYHLIFGIFSANLITVIFGWIILKINPQIYFHKNLIKEGALFLIPLVLFSIVAIFSASADKLILTYYYEYKDIAIYNGAFQICFALTMFGSIIQVGWSRDVYDINKWSKESLKKNLTGILILLLAVYIFFILIIPLIHGIIFPIEYSYGKKLLVYFLTGSLFQSFYFIAKPFFIIDNKRYELLYAGSISAILGLSLAIVYGKKSIVALSIVYLITWFLLSMYSLLRARLIFKNFDVTTTIQ